MMNDQKFRCLLDGIICEEVKRYITNRETIMKSWVMEWTEKGQQYNREDMEHLREEMEILKKKAVLPHRQDWRTGLEKVWVSEEKEECVRERRKMADRENERKREMDNERERMTMRVEDLERLVRELERRLRERHASEYVSGHGQEDRLRQMEAMFLRKLEKLEQTLDTRVIITKEENNTYMMEAWAKNASGEGHNDEKLPPTKPPVVGKGESAEIMARLQETERAIKEMDVRIMEKDKILKDKEIQMMRKDQILRDMELQMKKKDQILKDMAFQMKEKDELLQHQGAEYRSKLEMIEQQVRELTAANSTRNKQWCSSVASLRTNVDDETTDEERQSWTSTGMGSSCSKRRNGTSRKVAARRSAKTRSPRESDTERMRSRGSQQCDTSADSDISSIASAEPRSLAEKSMAASERVSERLADSRPQTRTSLDKTSAGSAASLAKVALGADAGQGEKGKSWKRAFGGLFKKKTKK
ncbi:golgin subfamily A member 6-like protein 2 isoform X2 [Alosa sapidissima]|uniref:golgin subfamily A member 6-like protein 2 isoform X2 n=1 Tax=Alosa sapidissima TaxID=34773 RepID=UPI001C085E2F|nr:golgin subfamily A member 6-like protein 2 isoform X2 [Alosa sapidissima]